MPEMTGFRSAQLSRSRRENDQAQDDRDHDHGKSENQHAFCGAQAVHATRGSNPNVNSP